MSRDFDSLVDPAWPPEVQSLRAAVWPVVKWFLPLRVSAAPEGDGLLAFKAQLLPRVPVRGEVCEVAGKWVPVDRVEWGADGGVSIQLKQRAANRPLLDALWDAGWTVTPRRDAEEWLTRLGRV